MPHPPALTASPFLAHGEVLTARRAMELTAMVRRARPGEPVLLRRCNNEMQAAVQRRAMVDRLGPNVVVYRDGCDVLVRARVMGEPLPQRSDARLADSDMTGEWMTIRAAAERVGVTHQWFLERYVHSGLVPAHRTARITYVRREDVERAREMRAGGAIFAADWPDTVDERYDPRSPSDAVRRAIEWARERQEG